jgi:hypothetical protein
LGDAHQQQRRIERHRGEADDREAGWLARIIEAGDDGHPGREAAERVAQRARIVPAAIFALGRLVGQWRGYSFVGANATEQLGGPASTPVDSTIFDRVPDVLLPGPGRPSASGPARGRAGGSLPTRPLVLQTRFGMIDPVVTSDLQTVLSWSGRLPVMVTSPGAGGVTGSAAATAGNSIKFAATISINLRIVPPSEFAS